MRKVSIFTSVVAAAVLAVPVLGSVPSVQAADSITVASWGGSFQEAERNAFFEPAAAALGITIKEDTTNGLQDVRAQVQSGNPTWDVTELGSNSCVQLKKEGMIEPLDYNIINTEGMPSELVDSHWIGIIFYATVLGYSTEKYPDGPKSWVDFFDTGKFPGARAMYRKPYGTLEIALMADGVEKENVYPLDVDRAFNKLATIKAAIFASRSPLAVNAGALLEQRWRQRIAVGLSADGVENSLDELRRARRFGNQALRQGNAARIVSGIDLQVTLAHPLRQLRLHGDIRQ